MMQYIATKHEAKIGDVVYLHEPEDPRSDRYSDDSQGTTFYHTLGIVVKMGASDIYVEIRINEEDETGILYHAGEITKIGELE